jgi:hypothetical protein
LRLIGNVQPPKGLQRPQIVAQQVVAQQAFTSWLNKAPSKQGKNKGNFKGKHKQVQQHSDSSPLP